MIFFWLSIKPALERLAKNAINVTWSQREKKVGDNKSCTLLLVNLCSWYCSDFKLLLLFLPVKLNVLFYIDAKDVDPGTKNYQILWVSGGLRKCYFYPYDPLSEPFEVRDHVTFLSFKNFILWPSTYRNSGHTKTNTVLVKWVGFSFMGEFWWRFSVWTRRKSKSFYAFPSKIAPPPPDGTILLKPCCKDLCAASSYLP